MTFWRKLDALLFPKPRWVRECEEVIARQREYWRNCIRLLDTEAQMRELANKPPQEHNPFPWENEKP